MKYKKCATCKVYKFYRYFYKNRVAKDGYSWSCKKCMKSTIADHAARNQKQLKIIWKNIRDKYLDDWKKFFELEYGKYPYCQVCNKKLSWLSKHHILSINFDHRHGKSDIIPKHWLRRPCNKDNIKIWRNLDFGLLCGPCNRKLPTNYRKKWLKSVIKYINGDI